MSTNPMSVRLGVVATCVAAVVIGWAWSVVGAAHAGEGSAADSSDATKRARDEELKRFADEDGFRLGIPRRYTAQFFIDGDDGVERPLCQGELAAWVNGASLRQVEASTYLTRIIGNEQGYKASVRQDAAEQVMGLCAGLRGLRGEGGRADGRTLFKFMPEVEGAQVYFLVSLCENECIGEWGLQTCFGGVESRGRVVLRQVSYIDQ